jgi:sugar phosphate isomerase/epimerase
MIGAGAALSVPTSIAQVTSAQVPKPSVSVFSKVLQWLDYEEMAAVVKEIGFDGIELTVRPQGHVNPESVVTELPKAVNAATKAGLTVPMIVTAISDATEPHTENILRTASEQGVKSYRLNWFTYDAGYSIDYNIKGYIDKFKALEKLNRKYHLRAEYQNHQGQFFGSAVWDLWLAVKDFDPAYIAIQFDAFHAAVEGFNTWPNEFNLVKSHVGSLPIKDLGWAKKENKWIPEVVPVGEGAVDFPGFFKLVKDAQLNVPYTVHYEFPLGGAQHGARQITMPREDILAAMKRDLDKVRSMIL